MHLKFISGRDEERSSLSLREQKITTQDSKKHVNQSRVPKDRKNIPFEGGRHCAQWTKFILLWSRFLVIKIWQNQNLQPSISFPSHYGRALAKEPFVVRAGEAGYLGAVTHLPGGFPTGNVNPLSPVQSSQQNVQLNKASWMSCGRSD